MQDKYADCGPQAERRGADMRRDPWSHSEGQGDDDVKDDQQIVHEKVHRGGESLNDKQIPPGELTTCDQPEHERRKV